MRKRRDVLTGLLAALGIGCRTDQPQGPAPTDGDAAIAQALEPLRKKRSMPAMAGALILPDGSIRVGVTGYRKHGSDVAVQQGDLFHIGSCTKAMTASLVARYIEAGRLRWDTPLAEALPDLHDVMAEPYRRATVEQLITNRAGAPEETSPVGKSLLDIHRLPGDVAEQRREYVRLILAQKPQSEPGKRFHYSNAGFTVAGHICERLMGKSWEELLVQDLAKPLGMTVGFGAMGTPERIDQPRQHTRSWGKTVAVEPDAEADNPPAISPAGRVHCSMTDWARFVKVHLGLTEGYLKPQTLERLQTPAPGGEYAGGWIAVDRDWAGGRALTHAGSNTMNYAVVWAAPKKRFAILIATNIAGSGIDSACDQAVGQLMDVMKPA